MAAGARCVSRGKDVVAVLTLEKKLPCHLLQFHIFSSDRESFGVALFGVLFCYDFILIFLYPVQVRIWRTVEYLILQSAS